MTINDADDDDDDDAGQILTEFRQTSSTRRDASLSSDHCRQLLLGRPYVVTGGLVQEACSSSANRAKLRKFVYALFRDYRHTRASRLSESVDSSIVIRAT